MSSYKGPVAVGLGVGLIGAASCWALWKYYKMERIPTEWRKVGKLGDLICFPIKSAGPLRFNEFDCSDLGIQHQWLKDRYFMIVNASGNFISARIHPKLVLARPKLIENELYIEAPDMEQLKINLKNPASDTVVKCTLWGKSIDCIDCGDESAVWFSKYLLNENYGLRLVHLANESKKVDRTRDKSVVNYNDAGVFPDLTSYCIINKSSVDDLNTRLDDKVTPQQFRPNFVVEGAKPYEEDSWQWVQIGDTVFKAVKYCTRCILTTINTETGLKHPLQEPLATLKKYRIIPDQLINKTDKTSPVMGVHLVLRKAGKVKIGDSIMVA